MSLGRRLLLFSGESRSTSYQSGSPTQIGQSIGSIRFTLLLVLPALASGEFDSRRMGAALYRRIARLQFECHAPVWAILSASGSVDGIQLFLPVSATNRAAGFHPQRQIRALNLLKTRGVLRLEDSIAEGIGPKCWPDLFWTTLLCD